MNRLILGILLYCSFALIACSTHKVLPSGNDKNHYSEVDEKNRASSARTFEPDASQRNLVQMLRTRPGISVTGYGNNIQVKINNVPNASYGSNDPLFVVDGMRMGRDFQNVNDTVQGAEVKSIMVLKDPADTAIYGVDGTNGVILIKTKK